MADAKLVNLEFSGLWSAPNPFSKVPPGGLEVADNVLVRQPSLIEPRRGYTASATNASGTIGRIFPWNLRLMAFSTSGALRNYNGSAWSSSYGTYTVPDSTNPFRAASGAKNFFFTTATGVKQLDSFTGTVQNAGLPPPQMLGLCGSNSGLDDVSVYNTVPTTGSKWLAAGYSVAYRAVLCRYDANNNLIQSAPSARCVVTNNTGAAAWVNVTFHIPSDLQGATFYQVYRSVSTTGTPSDELFQIAEATISASEITLGKFAIDDTTADSFLATPLYTNANTGGTVAVSNDLPPLARELCLFQNRMLYANTTSRHSLDFQFIGNTSGSQSLTIGAYTLSGSTGPPSSINPAIGQFLIYTGGTTAQNIEYTARSVCAALTQYSRASPGLGTPLTATYTSDGSVPGYFTVAETGIGGSAFTVSSAATTGYVPSILSPGQTSDNNRQPAMLWWSNDGQPWGVPADNWTIVGDPQKAILRIIPIRGVAFIFKEDGVWRMDGFDANGLPIITPFDMSIVLTAPESCAVLSNQVFCLTNKGVVIVSESGVSEPISAPIDRELSAILAANPQFTTDAFGVAYESDGLYCLSLPTGVSDTKCSQQYIFNAYNPSWTRWTIASTRHGCVDQAYPQELVWTVSNTLWLERTAYTSSDIQDPTGAFTCTVKTLPFNAQDPVSTKRWLDTYWAFRTVGFSSATVGFSSDRTATQTTVPLTPGAGSTTYNISRVNFPQGFVLASQLQLGLTVTQASAFWQLQGIVARYEPSTDTPRR